MTTRKPIDLRSQARKDTMPLEKELETYKQKLPELKESEGKYVLIQDSNVVDVFTSYDDAIKSGYQRFGLKPFLVKQVQSIEQVQFVSRLVDPCLQST